MSAPGFTPQTVDTARLRTNVWTAGPEDGTPLLVVHGNLATGAFWRYVAAELPYDVRVIAPDMRGFGRSERAPVDATRGLGDMVDDIRALLETLGLVGTGQVHAVGWSMGGGILQQYHLTHPADLASLTLVAPLSPYGFGGTRGPQGAPLTDDAAGTGGGGAASDFVRRLSEGDASEDDSQSSPRLVLRTFFGPRGNSAVDEDELVSELLLTAVGDDNYPGDTRASDSWPGFAAGTRGVLNAMAPCHFNTSALDSAESMPPIVWIHGSDDQVVSDRSMFDLATLGELGAVPGWPGSDTMPPQPMKAQMRAVLERYAAAGGSVREVALEGVGHGVPLEVPVRVAEEVRGLLRSG